MGVALGMDVGMGVDMDLAMDGHMIVCVGHTRTENGRDASCRHGCRKKRKAL